MCGRMHTAKNTVKKPLNIRSKFTKPLVLYGPPTTILVHAQDDELKEK
jgi:hypothetical protein